MRKGGYDLRSNMKRKGGYDLRSNLKRDEKTDFVITDSKKRTSASLARKKKDTRLCNEGETSESLIEGDLHHESNEGASWSELSGEVAANLSKSVVSLALLDGHNTVLFQCSGIAVQCKRHVTRLLTSASLLNAFNDKKKDHDNLKVEVHHEDNVDTGDLREYVMEHNMAAVVVKNLPDLRAVSFNYVHIFVPHNKVVALGRDISGKLMSTRGLLIGDSSRSYNDQLMSSTCKISKVYEGGPLFDSDGNFLGMNLSFNTKGTLFVPTFRVIEQYDNCIHFHEVEYKERLKSLKAARARESEMPTHQVQLDVLNKDRFGDLESLGYPEPPESKLNDGIKLFNTFEESFGDLWGEGGVWSKLSDDVGSNIHDNIVALASFNGKKRFFACTGYFIEWNEGAIILTSASLIRDSGIKNKIVENLRIEVLLPNKQRTEGTVEHCSLHYNVALVSVSVKDYYVRQPAKIQHQRHDNIDLLAVGCIAISGRLMAAKGKQFAITVTHDCKLLSYSSCQVTKAGIGGPLLDFDGNFIGMNLYDEGVDGTPFLSWCELREILKYFKTKGNVTELGHGDPSHMLDWKINGYDSNGRCLGHIGVIRTILRSVNMHFKSAESSTFRVELLHGPLTKAVGEQSSSSCSRRKIDW
uniref:Uncharacterized protein n=1 Tax=Leersia perrieri TaxID=77586 RepID=A0A0D9XNP7_9ORYZ